MLQTHKINKEVVAVAFHPEEIRLRKSGREFFDTEEVVAEIKDGVLYIYPEVSNKYGLEIKEAK